ncbi:Type II secretion system protein F [Calycomorphotria hydatis]|uniref:Type II secretion system protein F n=1 Tax=Calycomorphotria hydatis TaxID=2528027 RepID=A0A517T780_9PLAN|nr:Type II secretion system protein F [Calycomorphotria hydatis]
MLGATAPVPTKSLAICSRNLATLLESGVDIKKSFRVAGERSGDPRVRYRFAEISREISSGEDIASAMSRQGDAFPRLFREMVSVGEQTGAFPEVLRSLAEHYENNLRLRKMFIGALIWPAFQLVAAILIIALLIFILGIIASIRGGEPIDVLGWGLTGTSGALTWLLMTFGSMTVVFVAYKIIRSSLSGAQFVDTLLLKVPVLGKALRSLAIARFSWAFAMTQQAGMPIDKSLVASFRATSNGAFTSAAGEVWAAVEGGENFTTALAHTELFPSDYLHIVEVGEQSGTVPETLERIGPELEEEARRSLTALVAAAAWLIWALVAGFIIMVIFSIFSFYLNALNDAMSGV